LHIAEGANDMTTYSIFLGDNSLMLGHRNSEWCGHGPVLEQDIAITNISLDLIGQARYFYQLAAHSMPEGTTEDTLAYTRDVRDFRNCLITELPRGDWAFTVLRQFFFSNYQSLVFQKLAAGSNPDLSAIAGKALKETNYHLRWSSEWVIRLGDGTEESHRRILNALETLWSYTGELFQPADYESVEMTGFDLTALKEPWLAATKEVFGEAGITVPAGSWSHSGGKSGSHTEHLGFLLADLQFVQRAYPNSAW
jgi:ring-1,2-phenylacetyl-CoA epoxidase subunit PaaC